MRLLSLRPTRASLAGPGAALFFTIAVVTTAAAQAQRAVTFLDVENMRSARSEALSPDGRWMVYTVSTPDWHEAQDQSDIHLVSLQDGVSSSRQMTFTREHDESSPQWSRDGRFFVFLSNRDAPADAARRNQLYLLRPNGGEARPITDAPDGVLDFAFSRDGRSLVFRAGKSNEEQLYRLPVAAIGVGDAEEEQLTRQPAGVSRWELAPDSRRIYFVSADSVDTDEKRRLENDFTVNVYHMDTPLESLWALDLDPVRASRLTRDPSISVTGFTISDDSRWVGFQGVSSDRFERTRGGTNMGSQSNLYTELY